MPACASCNTSKCNNEVSGWLRRKRLDEGAFLLRHVELQTALMLDMTLEPDTEPPGAASRLRRSGGGSRYPG